MASGFTCQQLQMEQGKQGWGCIVLVCCRSQLQFAGLEVSPNSGFLVHSEHHSALKSQNVSSSAKAQEANGGTR